MTDYFHKPIKIKNFIVRADKVSRLDSLPSERGSLVVVAGRRRVGKTSLIEQYEYHDRGSILLKFEGLQPTIRPRMSYQKEKKRQLVEAVRVLGSYLHGSPIVSGLSFSSYIDFFAFLADWIASLAGRTNSPIVLLLDEIQWMAAYGDELFSELKPIWDNRLAHLANMRLYISGSSPSFVVSQFSKNAALFGREDLMIPLRPFTIAQTAQYMRQYRHYGRRDILAAQLVTGGVVGYLEAIARGHDSVFAGLVKEFFRADGRLFTAYERTFVSSLTKNKHYKKIIRYLAHQPYATREQIARHLQSSMSEKRDDTKTSLAGGRISELLDDLIGCEFIERYTPLTHPQPKSRLVRYRIRDAYLHFYHRVVEQHCLEIIKGTYNGSESNAVSRHQYAIALGFAFERFVIGNSSALAEMLQFADTTYSSGSFFNRKADQGFQIDLLYIRRDNTLVFCEIKHWHTPVSAKKINTELERKIEQFHELTARHYQNYNLRKILIATEGVDDPQWASEFFDRVITLEMMFAHWQIAE